MKMAFTDQAHEEQEKLWNGSGGCAWVEEQELLERIFKPFEEMLVKAVGVGFRGDILDVGCGTGSTTMALARMMEGRGRCTGIDISDPMLAVARARAERESIPASFIRADAQSYPFEPESFDMIVSRFGVMFFDDSAGAFANLRRAARNNAGLRFIAWRSAEENPFMTTAERAAAPVLPNIPVRQPDAPGQFAFANKRRVHSILEESGWTAIDIRPADVICTLPENGLMGYLTRLGPVGRILQDVDQRTRAKVVETVRAAFEPFVHGSEVRFTAACWMVSASAVKTSQ
jgi:ubiquinone/menaquinone biosynthesis C-methylase UbiE